MGTVNPNDEPEDQAAAIGPAVTHPEADEPAEAQEEAEPAPKGKKKGDA